MKFLATHLVVIALVLAAAGAFVFSGTYEIGADEPHWPLTSKVIDTLRDRSLEKRAHEVPPAPNLQDPDLIAAGAEHYSEMCTGCHLAPGVEDSEIRAGLYPKPPNLAEPSDLTPAEQFWVIKHGMKLTAMPAWGTTHDDDAIWSLVAFVQQLPGMTAEQYRSATAVEESTVGHEHHGHEHAEEHSEASPPPVASAAPDSAEAAVDNFFRALASGDAKEAARWLTPDVLIYESGHAQKSRDEYMAHHLKEDMAFLAKAKVERVDRTADAGSATAWVATRSRIHGQSGERSVALDSTETMVLTREKEGWRIQHIHWSSAD